MNRGQLNEQNLPGFSAEASFSSIEGPYYQKNDTFPLQTVLRPASNGCPGCAGVCKACEKCLKAASGTASCMSICESCWACDCPPQRSFNSI